MCEIDNGSLRHTRFRPDCVPCARKSDHFESGKDDFFHIVVRVYCNFNLLNIAMLISIS